MDDRLWNLLHDGTVESVSGSVGRNVVLAIRIPYIREMFPGEGSGEDGGLVIVLHNCSSFRFEPNEGDPIQDLATIGASELWILSAEPGNPLRVCTGRGDLVLAYNSVSLSLDSGESISLEELDDASERYWTAWEARARDHAAP